VSAISHIGDSFSQNPRELPTWEAAADRGQLPVYRGVELDLDDLLRGEVIQQLMCQGEIDIAALEHRYEIDFPLYFATALTALAALSADGLVEVETPYRCGCAWPAAVAQYRDVLRPLPPERPAGG
jgi:oxygen-independent coproporphyrinogen III oxidase